MGRFFSATDICKCSPDTYICTTPHMNARHPQRCSMFASCSQALPLMALEMGVAAQELSLEEVVPTTSSSGMLDDGKLDLVIVTVPETATVEVLYGTVQADERAASLAAVPVFGGCCCSLQVFAHQRRALAMCCFAKSAASPRRGGRK